MSASEAQWLREYAKTMRYQADADRMNAIADLLAKIEAGTHKIVRISDRRRELGVRKTELQARISKLKDTLGINRNWKNGMPLPQKIIRTPEFSELMGKINEVTQVDVSILRLKESEIAAAEVTE